MQRVAHMAAGGCLVRDQRGRGRRTLGLRPLVDICTTLVSGLNAMIPACHTQMWGVTIMGPLGGSGIAMSRRNTGYKGTVVAPQVLGATIMDNNDEASLENMSRGGFADSLDDR